MSRSAVFGVHRCPLAPLIITLLTPVTYGGIVYVDRSATLAQDGTTWCKAFRDLQDGLAAAQPGDEIRVANGVYFPDRGTGDRLATFTLKSGVALKGGYAGCGPGDQNARDYALYETRLSGDLLEDDGPDFGNYADNSYHVVTYDDPAAIDVLIEGFTVSSGNSDGHDGLTNQGGGIHIRQGLVKCLPGGPTIRDCIIERCFGHHHGAVNDHGLATVIENCIIRYNHSDEEGGGLQIHSGAPTVRDCTFLENTSGGDGGGAWVGTDTDPTCSGPSTATFIDCIFEGNTAEQGGGMFQAEGTRPTVIGTSFTQNTALLQGGGVWFRDNEPTFTNCHFEANVAEDGGGMHQGFGSRPMLSACVFLQNHAFAENTRSPGAAVLGEAFSPDGGAVWFMLNEPTFLDCQFIGNTAVNEGGGTWGARAEATFERCVWDGNSAGEDGGGYYAGGVNSNSVVVTESIVRNNNSGRFGGGFNLYAVTSVVTDTLFENNYGYLAGGGAAAHLQFTPVDFFQPCGPGECQAVYEDCVFRNNSSANGGGFMGGYSSRPVLRRVLFENNESAHVGGGVHINGIGGPLFSEHPEAGRAHLSECIFRGNSAAYGGGGLQGQSGAVVTMSLCDFFGNSAGSSGGGVQMHYHARATILSSRFLGNWTSGNWGSGGAVVVSDETEVLIGNSLFAGNRSISNGGAVNTADQSVVTVVNSTLTSNSSVQFGGALSATPDCNAQLINSIAWDNQAGTGSEVFGSSVGVSYSSVEGGWPGEGNMDADPLFIDPLGPDEVAGTEDDDLRLSLDSPALNAASAAMLPADLADLDGDGDTTEPLPVDLNGDARLYGPGLDMGALETSVVLCSPGTFSASGEEPCTPCDPGSAQPNSGATACTPCTPGTFASTPGATVCSPCPAGTFQPSPGAVACMACGSCDDGNACTDDGCDAVSGACVNVEVCTIPAASTWSLAGFALLLLIAGTLGAMNRGHGHSAP